MKINNIEISTQSKLRRDLALQAIGREIQNGEVDKGLKVGGYGTRDEVGRKVKRLKVGAVGEKGGDGAAERETGERELVDAAVVAGGALKIGGETAARVGEIGFGPVLKGPIGVF